MKPPEWIAQDPLLHEAYKHGRTQELLTATVQCLKSVEATCRGTGKKLTDKAKLEMIRIEVEETLRRLSAPTGGVIDDVSPTKE